MKKICIGSLFFCASFVFASCNNRDENGSTDTSNTNSAHSVTDSTRGDNPMDTSGSKMSTMPADKESTEFAMKAGSGGMLEVQLGQLAQQNAKSQRVKDFGAMMVTDHSKANEELKSIAASHNITVPSALMPEHQKHVDMMSKMKGADFDKHYMDMMVDDHKEDISDFTKEASGNKTDAFKDFAAKTLPVLEKHLDSAKAIHSSKM
jgi:putative membrane protein